MGQIRISKEKLDMGGAPIKNIGAPSEAADAVTKNYVDDFVIGSVEKTGRAATYVVAASDAPAHVKAQADFVCDGVDDHVEIQAAVDALPATGGDIVFVGPRFIFGATVTTTKPSIRWLGGGGSTWLGGAEATAVGAVEFATSAEIQILEVGSPTTVTHRGHHFENIVFRDISAGQDTALGGLMIRRQNHTRITNCSFMNFQKSGAVGLGFQQTSICPIIMGVLARQCDTAIDLRATAAHVIGGFIALCKLGIDVPLGAELFFDGNIDACDVGIHLKTDGSWINGRFESNGVAVKVSRNNNVVGGVHSNNTTDVEIEAGSNQTLLTLRMFGGTPTIVDNGASTFHLNRFLVRPQKIELPSGSAAAPTLALAAQPDFGFFRVNTGRLGLHNNAEGSGAHSRLIMTNGNTGAGSTNGLHIGMDGDGVARVSARDGAGPLIISTTTANAIRFFTNNVERWRILTTGQLRAQGSQSITTTTGDLTLDPDGDLILANLPVTDPNKAGALWNDAGTLKISSG